MQSFLLQCAVASAVLLGSARSFAEVRDPVAAEALFTEGRKAFERGDVKSACARFDESQRLDPAVGTLLNLARCKEQLGQTATAWQNYKRVIDQLQAKDERRTFAQDKVTALEKRLPKLVIQLALSAPKDARVTRDGVELGAASLGLPLPVDPGEHEMVVTAPGRMQRRWHVVVRAGETKEIAVEPGALVQSAVTIPPSALHETRPAVAVRMSPSMNDADMPQRASSSSARTLGWILGGVGAAGLATGAVTGWMTVGKKSDVDKHCDEDGGCDGIGFDAASNGATLSKVSTGAFVVGAIGLGAGLTLLLTSKSEHAPQTALVVHGSGVSVLGRFE